MKSSRRRSGRCSWLALFIAAPGLLTVVPQPAGAGPLQESREEAIALEISPSEAFPLQEIALRGLPDGIPGIGFRALPLNAENAEGARAIPLYAVRLESGIPVFAVPPHPNGLDAGGRFRIEFDDVSAEPLILVVRPLPADGDQTERLLEDLGRISAALTRAGRGELIRLREGPIEEVPLHLFSVALSLRALNVTGEAIAAEDLAWADRWLATRPSWEGLSRLADRLSGLPEPPVESGGREARLRQGGAGEIGSPYQLASVHAVDRRAWTVDGSGDASRPPWEKVEICNECPGALNHWMNVQSEMARGYGNLAERMARDRDLFDFVESLKPLPPDRETQAMTEALSYAREKAKEGAGTTFENLETPAAKRGLALLEAVLGVAKLTFDLNDKFLASLLPAELLPASGGVLPNRFNEDDKRAEPGDADAATWRMRVTARSGQLAFSPRELLDYFSRLKSVVGSAGDAVWEDDETGTKHGLCVAGGVASEDDPTGTGEAACALADQLIDQTSKAVKEYEKARRYVDGAQDVLGNETADRLPEPNFEPVQYGPYVWPGINVSDPRWSTARALGGCVQVVVKSWNTASQPWTEISYSPSDPAGSWGTLADLEHPPDIGIKPAAVGDCDVRLATRGDRFGSAGSIHLDVPVSVDEILVLVNPNPITMEPEDDQKFQATVRYADSVKVAWSAPSGDGEEEPCESSERGRPCYRWTAPDLNEGECSRDIRITAKSLARRGLRALGGPAREGSAAVRIVDPDAEMEITQGGSVVTELTLDPEERRGLSVSGPAARAGEIRWTASGGTIGETGRRTTYVAPGEAGTYRITASSEQSASCSPSIIVTVVPPERPCYWKANMNGAIDGVPVQRSLSGESVSPGYGRALPNGRILSGMGLGQAPGSDETDGLSFFLDGPLERRSYRIGPRQRSGAMVSTRETPFGRVGRGELQITLLKPDTLIVGGFAIEFGGLAAPDFGDAVMEMRGEFVWSPSCPTFWEQMQDLGERTRQFLESRDIE